MASTSAPGHNIAVLGDSVGEETVERAILRGPCFRSEGDRRPDQGRYLHGRGVHQEANPSGPSAGRGHTLLCLCCVNRGDRPAVPLIAGITELSHWRRSPCVVVPSSRRSVL